MSHKENNIRRTIAQYHKEELLNIKLRREHKRKVILQQNPMVYVKNLPDMSARRKSQRKKLMKLSQMSEVAVQRRTALLTPTANVPLNSRQTTSPMPKQKLFESGVMDDIREGTTSNGS